MVVKIQMI